MFVSFVVFSNQTSSAGREAVSWRHDDIVQALQRARAHDVARYANRHDVSKGLASSIVDAARRTGVPVPIAFRLVRRESSFNASAISSVEALGLTQVKLTTARTIENGVTRHALLTDKRLNLRIGFTYLKRMRDRFGNWRVALQAYVDGPTDVADGSRAGMEYANDVLER